MTDLRELARVEDRPLSTLKVLDDDPFHLEPARIRNAEWFAALWQRLGRPGLHVHGFHYVLVSQPEPILLPLELKCSADESSNVYLNTDRCDKFLRTAGRDARYLGLIPAGSIADRRNDAPIIPEFIETAGPQVLIEGGVRAHEPIGFDVPRLIIEPPVIRQRYRIEIWCEKSTMQDYLLPLKEQFNLTLETMGGEASLTLCEEFVNRSVADGRPIRVLYISDFDPAGVSMPVAAARKIQFLIEQQDRLDIDIQLRPVVLTHEQCVGYRLPRTPLKETERRAARFEERFGEGGTELDALEALRPGQLRRILVEEISRYYDDDLANNINDVADQEQAALDAVNDRVAAAHRKEVSALIAEQKKLQAAIVSFDRKAAKVENKITRGLHHYSADLGKFGYPEPADGDDDDNPLFDSTRDFIEQTDRFKEHQGKDTARAARQLASYTCTCITCGTEFTAVRRTAKYCNAPCRKPHDPNRNHKKKGSRE